MVPRPGRRGAGKTTLLNQVAAEMRASGAGATEVEGRLATTGADLIRLVRSRLLPASTRPRSYEGVRRELLSNLDGRSRWDETGQVQEPLVARAASSARLHERPIVGPETVLQLALTKGASSGTLLHEISR